MHYPSRHFCAASLVLVLVTVTGCGDPATSQRGETGSPVTFGDTGSGVDAPPASHEYRSPDFSFRVPDGWSEVSAGAEASFGTQYLLSSVAVAPAASAQNSLAIVVAYDLSQVERYPWNTDDFVRTYTEAVGGTVTSEPRRLKVDGHPGDRYGLSFDVEGEPVKATVVRVFESKTVFLVQCQSEAPDIEAMEQGCEEILRSFRVR